MQKALFLYYREIVESFVDKEYSQFVYIEPPKDESFGDFSTNIAMLVAKKIGRSPIEFAEEICSKMQNNENFDAPTVKGPGFINWSIPRKILFSHFPRILAKDYGKANIGNGIPINIEFVSANPTGPLHAGHARGAVAGDVLSNLLSFVGYDVTKEYYVNDAGNQIEALARSLYLRYLEIFKKSYDRIPVYPGAYLIDTAKKLASIHGDLFVDKEESEWMDFFKSFAIEDMMANIKSDMEMLGIKHDVFTNESSIVNRGAVDDIVNSLRDKNLVYRGVLNVPKGKESDDWEPREQLLFRSTEFGDDVDRPLQKSDGSWTYFSSDIAYHMDKINRGFVELIDFWGADHGGYIKRMKAAVSAISGGTRNLEVKISQIVKFVENGNEVKMSKRAGTFITVKDIIDSVGKDVIRFIMLTRRDDIAIDFDFEKVVSQSRDNPVFYIQYAYARTHSVLKQFTSIFPNKAIPNFDEVDLSRLDRESDLSLIKILSDWPRQVMAAAKNREPHRLAFYLSDVAATFHSLWNQGNENSTLRFIIASDFDRTCARMILLKAIQNVIEIAFEIIGITPAKELR
jgi:arginyl-tRNA synthetase